MKSLPLLLLFLGLLLLAIGGVLVAVAGAAWRDRERNW